MKSNVTIDPKTLREECLSLGLFIRVGQDLVIEQRGRLDEETKEGILLLGATFLYGQALSRPALALYYAALAYEQRKFELHEGEYYDYPLWGEGEEKEEERYADAFFSLYALYLGEKEGNPSDYLGPLQFFSGAIKEDILEALQKKKGDPHYDAFYTEISSYPFAQEMGVTALKLYHTAHPENEA